MNRRTRDPGAARPDGHLHLATFRPRLRREYGALGLPLRK